MNNSLEISELYFNHMNKKLLKSASKVTDIYNAVVSGTKSLTDLLDDAGMTISAYIKELNSLGKSSDEIAQQTGKSLDEIAAITGTKLVSPILLQAKQFKLELEPALKIAMENISIVDQAVSKNTINSLTNEQLIKINRDFLVVKKYLDEKNNLLIHLKGTAKITNQISPEDFNEVSSICANFNKINRIISERNSKIEEIMRSKGAVVGGDNFLHFPESKPTEPAELLKEDVSTPNIDRPKTESEISIPNNPNTNPVKAPTEPSQKTVKQTVIPPKIPKPNPISESDAAAQAAGEFQAISEAAVKSGDSELAVKAKTQAESIKSSLDPEDIRKSEEYRKSLAKKLAEDDFNSGIKDKSYFEFLRDKFKEVSKKIIENGIESGFKFATSTVLLGGIKFAMFAGIAYYIYSKFIKEYPNESQTIIPPESEIKTVSKDLSLLLSELLFIDDESEFKKYIDILSNNLKIVEASPLFDSSANESEFNNSLLILDNLSESINQILSNQSSFISSVKNPDVARAVVIKLNNLQSRTNQIKVGLVRLKQSNPELQQGRKAPDTDTTEKAIQPLTIFGETIDLSRLSPQMRSAAPKIAQDILNSPEGLVFIDPDNIWGGWLKKDVFTDSEGNQSTKPNYLEAIKYLYLNKIFSRHDLNKFYREKLPRISRKKHSGFRDALKYYKNYTKKVANKNIFTQNNKFSANYATLDVIHEEKNYTKMEKLADKASKDFYKKLLKGISDSYTESYFESQKKQYEYKPKKRKADFNKLHNLTEVSIQDMMKESHPDAVNWLPAMGNGGLIENKLEQHDFTTRMLTDMPHANFHNRIASIMKSLVKLADLADLEGQTDASNLIDQTLLNLDELILSND